MPKSKLSPGLYASTYITESGYPFLLGRWTRHDNAVALWEYASDRLTLLRLWELERRTGIKHHGAALASDQDLNAFLDELLASVGLNMADLSGVVGTPGISTLPSRYVDWWEHSTGLPIHSVAHLLTGDAGPPNGAVPSENSMILAVDGGPDFVLSRPGVTYGRWFGAAYRHGDQWSTWFVPSPGPLYAAARRAWGLEEGSLMALAGTVRLTDHAAELDLQPPDLDLAGPDCISSADRVVAHIGRLAAHVRMTLASHVEYLSRDVARDTSTLDVAIGMNLLQRLCTEMMCRVVEKSIAISGARPQETDLAICGGFGLNCPTNTAIMDRLRFASLSTPPWVNDAGQAIGLGIAALSFEAGRYLTPIIDSPFLGSGVEARKPSAAPTADESVFDENTFVADVSRGPVGWVAGLAEGGPRALGHRSLLADPRSLATKETLNRLKGRQIWRPVAPVVIEGEASRWFTLERSSRFMLEACAVRPASRDLIPAVVHSDGTARVQTVSPDSDPLLFRALTAFWAVTGVPVLCNTSLNDRGEPIADDVSDALRFCARKGVDVLYVNGRRVAVGLEAHIQPTRDGRAFARAPRRLYAVNEVLNPFDLEHKVLDRWYLSDQRTALDPRTLEDIDELLGLLEHLRAEEV